MKKKLFFGLLAAAGMLFAASCSNDELESPALSGDESVVTFTLEQPGIATRTYSDGESATKLSYAVYESGETTPLISSGDSDGDEQVTFSGKTATVNLRLVNGKTYDLIFWADNEAAPYTFSAANQTVTIDYTTNPVVSQDETLDAFYAARTELKIEGTTNETIQLKRPFAQMNIATTDAEAAATAGYVPTQSKLTVSNVYKTLSLIDGKVSDGTEVTYAYAALPGSSESFPVANTDDVTYTYLSMNYLLVDSTEEVVDITFDVNDATSSNEIENKYYSVPVQRNYQTNIYGNLLTEQTTITVEIKPEYDVTNSYDAETYTEKADLTVTSADGTLSFTDNVASVSLDATDTEYSFNITTGTETTAWTATSDNDAFTLTSAAQTESTASYTGNGTLNVAFDANTSVTAKEAAITVATAKTTLTINLTQAGVTPTATLTAGDITSSSLAFTVALTNATGYYYSLIKTSDAESSAPTAETLKTGTLYEATGSAEITVSDLDAETGYTLYVLPAYASDGVDTVYGDIVSQSATTAVAPSATVTAGEVTSSSELTFTVALTNATGYYYELITTPTEGSGPTADELKALSLQETTNTSVELTLSADADNNALTASTAYTLYVLPVNDVENGAIASEEATTAAEATAATYTSLYTQFTTEGSITIAGVTYNSSDYVDKINNLTTAATLSNTAGIYFLKSGEEFTLPAVSTDIILIGDDPTALTTVKPSAGNQGLTAGSLVMYNINFDLSAISTQAFNMVSATTDITKFHIDACTITNLSNPILFAGGTNYDNVVNSIKVINSSIQMTGTANVQMFNFANTTSFSEINEFIFDNNIVYNSSIATLQILQCNSKTQDSTNSNAVIQFTNNTIANSPGLNSYIKFYNGALNISNNIFYCESTNTSNSYLVCTYASTPDTSYTIADNYVYDAANMTWKVNYNSATTYAEESANLSVLSSSPFTEADCTNGIFTQASDYENYGAK